MAPNIIMAKVAGTTQAAQINAMAGKTYVVGKVTAAKKGLGSWLFLSPTGGAGGTTAIKLEGTRQMAQFMPMVGKTDVVCTSPAVAVYMGQWRCVPPSVRAAAQGAAPTDW